MMKEATKRSMIRWMHLVFSIPILGYNLQSVRKTSRLCSRNSVCLPSCNGPFRDCGCGKGHVPSTAHLEKSETAKAGRLNSNAPNKTTRMKTGQEIRGLKTPMNSSERIDELIAELIDWRGQTFTSIRKRASLRPTERSSEEWKWMGKPSVVSRRNDRGRQRPQR